MQVGAALVRAAPKAHEQHTRGGEQSALVVSAASVEDGSGGVGARNGGELVEEWRVREREVPPEANVLLEATRRQLAGLAFGRAVERRRTERS